MRQVRKVWVPLSERTADDEHTTHAWAQVERLVAEGWNVVATVPIVFSPLCFTQTRGYEVILQHD